MSGNRFGYYKLLSPLLRRGGRRRGFDIAANVATVNALVADVRRAGGSWKQWTLLSPKSCVFFLGSATH